MSALAVRRSSLPGRWYPADPAELRALVELFFAHVPAQALQGELAALIAPHAGYPFSGQTAAHGYKQVIGQHFDGVVVLGPSHFAWVGEFALSYASAYQTPLGAVPLAHALIAELN